MIVSSSDRTQPVATPSYNLRILAEAPLSDYAASLQNESNDSLAGKLMNLCASKADLGVSDADRQSIDGLIKALTTHSSAETRQKAIGLIVRYSDPSASKKTTTPLPPR